MSNVGRISGPLLKENLERKGIDLAFETDLLYLDVQNRRVGVKRSNLSADVALNVASTGTRTTDLLTETSVVNGITLGVNGDITSVNGGNLTISAPQGINIPKLYTDDLQLVNSTLATSLTNSNIVLDPAGRVNFGGTTEVTGNVLINGNALYFTYTIEDPLPQSEVGSLVQDIRPSVTNTGSVGNQDYSWQDAFFETVRADNISLPTGADFGAPLVFPGNILYVSTTGSDDNLGNIQFDAFRTVKKALLEATSGTTVYIFSGTYSEVFPLTVPAGVSVIGQNIRQVVIQPTAGTIDKDAFLLNGETTIEDLTVSGFRYNTVNNTGHAFRFANNVTITSKSPYIRNVSVITRGSVTSPTDTLGYDTHDAGRGAYIDGSVANSASVQASMLFNGVTLITPGVDAVTMTNGVRVEWIDSFTYFANIGLNATQGTSGFSRFDENAPASITVGPAPTGVSLTSNSVTLPKTSYSQALVDSLVGQTAVIDRYPAAPLYYTVVSIETEPLSPTEWRMTVDTTFNPAGQLKSVSFYPDIETTQIITNDIWATTGNSVGEKWVAYYKTDLPSFFATTVEAGWTIDVAGTLYIVDYVIEDPVNNTMWRIYVTTSLVAGVGIPIFTSPGGFTKIYGAEVRSITSANVYGKYGAVGDGADVLMYLIGHNFAYIGTEKDSSNDNFLRVQAYEVVESNGAKIVYSSTDNAGNFRIGDAFLVNFKDGTTSFDSAGFDLSGLSTITIISPESNTILAPYKVESNNFRFSGSTVETIAGPINFRSASGTFVLDDNVVVSKNLTVSGDVAFKGTITVGDQSTDTVAFSMQLPQDVVPNVGDTYDLGSNTKRWSTSWINKVSLPSLTIDNDVITATNSNLNLVGNGTAGVVVDGITFTDNILSTPTGVNIRLKTKTGSSAIVYIDSTETLRLPAGTPANKPVMNTGEIRYDNVSNLFVGQSLFRTALGGVFSANRATKIVADSTNNTIPLVANNIATATIVPTGISAIGVTVDQIAIANNIISTSGTNNLNLEVTGNATVNINAITFDNSEIINTTNGEVTLAISGNGYFRLSSKTAIQIETSTDLAPLTNEVGTLRFNPVTECVEVWDGDSFDNVGGVGGNATEDDVEQLTNLWTLILG